MTQLKRQENSTLLFLRQIISRRGRRGSGVCIFSWPAINLQREKQKSYVSQLSFIVISQAENIRNNTMEMDLHNNTWAYALRHFSRPRGESEPAFFCTAVFLFLMLDNLKLTYFFYEVPVFPGVQGLRKPNLPHFSHLQGKVPSGVSRVQAM